MWFGGDSTDNLFSLPKPIGGNFWSDWTTPDNDSDGFVDFPYVFTGSQDDLPWARENGWLNQPPVAMAGDNLQIDSILLTSTVIYGTATDPDGDSLLYRWKEGDVLTVSDWSPVGENGEAYLDLGLSDLSIGVHTLTLEVSDGELNASDNMILTIDNSPPDVVPSSCEPTLQIGVDNLVITAQASDFDGDVLSYIWLIDSYVIYSGDIKTPMGGDPVDIPYCYLAAGDPRLTLGEHIVALYANDGNGNEKTVELHVTVKDDVAPSLNPIPDTLILWPPNHELHPVKIEANAYDNGGGIIVLAVDVISSEPLDTNGDGTTIPDSYVDSIDNDTGLIELRLRSERSGKGEGRTYTITITATDELENQSSAVVTILAPHDRRKIK